jgi:hypothetical protein
LAQPQPIRHPPTVSDRNEFTHLSPVEGTTVDRDERRLRDARAGRVDAEQLTREPLEQRPEIEQH